MEKIVCPFKCGYSTKYHKFDEEIVLDDLNFHFKTCNKSKKFNLHNYNLCLHNGVHLVHIYDNKCNICNNENQDFVSYTFKYIRIKL